MAKVFGVSSTVFIDTPERTRLDIKRSRFPVKSDKHISEATERRLARFTSATGLRRAEMTRITSDDLFFEDGKAYLDVTKGTKGGKARIVEIMGASEEETEDIVKFIQSKRGEFSLNFIQITTITTTVVPTQCAYICTMRGMRKISREPTDM